MTPETIKEWDLLARKHPAFDEMEEVASDLSSLGGSLLRDLFKLYVRDPEAWASHHWIKSVTYGRGRRKGGGTSSSIRLLGGQVKVRLNDRVDGDWIIALLTSKRGPRNSVHWKLDIKPRTGRTKAKTGIGTEAAVFAPEFFWQVGDYENNMPVWLPFAPVNTLVFLVKVSSKWIAPPLFADYNLFKNKRWEEKQIQSESDIPICSFKSFRELTALTRDLPVEIDVRLAHFSDYCATNELFVEWRESVMDAKLAKEFKTKLGPMLDKAHFPANAANALAVMVNLRTRDNKIVLMRSTNTSAWSSPARGLLDPFKDVHRTSPFEISPLETALRMMNKNLGIPVYHKSILWEALALNRDNGVVALLGEMELDFSSDEVKACFNNRRLTHAPSLLFLDLTPNAVIDFLRTSEPWAQQFLEIGLALSLRKRFENEVVIKV
jgi:hypothetical protein